MVVMAPKDENELRRMMKTALSHNGPIAFRYPRGACEGAALDEKIRPLTIGKAEILETGDDLLILAVGRTVKTALEAHATLREQNINATIVNSRFIKPIDADLIVSLVEKTPRILTVEENVLSGGFGSAVLECLNDSGIGGYCLRRLGIPDTFVEHGPQDILRSRYGIDAPGIVHAAHNLLKYESKKTETRSDRI